MKIKLFVMAIILSVLAGCANQGVKSPCDQYARFCESKTKINQW